MAHILTLPPPIRLRPARAIADTLSAKSEPVFETLLDGLRSAWWDGSSVGLSRAGLEALVGLEPSDATPRRRLFS
ncbi:hypothetical protein ASG52_14615 [Methylobacterium sp. Leaf456]|nr:hypothetical protein ASG52_14615 [Methylobacterium sp. Leaf456]